MPFSAFKCSCYFTFWISRAGPGNGFQRRRNSNMHFSFPHSSATGILLLVEWLELLQLESSFHVRFTCIVPACKRLWSPGMSMFWQKRGRSCHLKQRRAKPPLPSCFSPAREGDCLAVWVVWLKYQGYTTANDGHRGGSFNQIQNKSRTPCKQQQGMCSHNTASLSSPSCPHPSVLLSHRARDVFASNPLNHLLTTKLSSFLSTDLALASNNSRKCSFVLVYWIIDNEEFWWRGSSEPYRGERSCSKSCYVNAD